MTQAVAVTKRKLGEPCLDCVGVGWLPDPSSSSPYLSEECPTCSGTGRRTRSIPVVEDHPEERCQRCGGRNPVWNVDSDRYDTAVNRSEIVCPTCFVLAHERATGMRCCWQLTPMTPFRWIEDAGRPTPLIPVPAVVTS